MDEPAGDALPREDGPRPAPPAKKPLEQFLAEFEERLRDHPGEPATGALMALDDRAAGTRHSTIESEQDRPPRLPRPRAWRPAPAPTARETGPAALAAPAPEAPAETAPAEAEPEVEAALPQPEEAPPEPPPATPAAIPSPPASAQSGAEHPTNPAPRRHHRRRRRHR